MLQNANNLKRTPNQRPVSESHSVARVPNGAGRLLYRRKCVLECLRKASREPRKTCCDCRHFRMWKPVKEYCTKKKAVVEPLKENEPCWILRKGLKFFEPDKMTIKDIEELADKLIRFRRRTNENKNSND